MRRLLPLLLLAFSLQANCAELAGVKLDDTVTVAGKPLQLNGMAVRSRFVFDVYVAGLYLPEKTQSAEKALAMPGPRRMTLVMLRDVGADQFAGAVMDGLRDNNSEAELGALRAQVNALLATMLRIGEAKKGMVIDLDFTPGTGTSVRANGAPQGEPIAGDAFYPALLKTWLGERPVQPDLKKALLGG